MNCLEIYRCSRCKMQFEVTAVSEREIEAPLCCGIPMQRQGINLVDGAGEKHLPVVESKEDGIVVKIGSVPHPMTQEHFIEWIEVLWGSYSARVFLKPGDLPQAPFCVPMEPDLIVRASCNIHGLWETRGARNK